jgi:glucosamine--fructose-6-phosphate aminotransferase (isomerizing)
MTPAAWRCTPGRLACRLRARSTSRVAELMNQVQADALQGGTGIAHTRWATHGAPAVHNAHPHFSHGPGADARTARAAWRWCTTASSKTTTSCVRAAGQGLCVQSQTDTEVIATLVDSLYDGDLFEAVKAAVASCTAPTPLPCSTRTSRTA